MFSYKFDRTPTSSLWSRLVYRIKYLYVRKVRQGSRKTLQGVQRTNLPPGKTVAHIALVGATNYCILVYCGDLIRSHFEGIEGRYIYVSSVFNKKE